jgi:hypothetical protein
MDRQGHHPPLQERFALAPPPPEKSDAGRRDGASAEDAGRQSAPCPAKADPETGVRIIKSVLGFHQFSLRGLEKVRGEWSLVTLAWNIKRMFVLNPA